jgi:hypothetical protein
VAPGRADPAELGTAQYIDYPYWTDFSGGSRLAADGASLLGPWQDQPPGTIYRQIAENARDGRLPPPIILISEPGLANLVVIEGHKRLTGLLLCPQWLPAVAARRGGGRPRHHRQPRQIAVGISRGGQVQPRSRRGPAMAGD